MASSSRYAKKEGDETIICGWCTCSSEESAMNSEIDDECAGRQGHTVDQTDGQQLHHKKNSTQQEVACTKKTNLKLSLFCTVMSSCNVPVTHG